MRDNARRLLTILTVILALWLVLGFWPLSIGNQVIFSLCILLAGGRRGALASASPGSQPSAIGNRPAARGFSGGSGSGLRGYRRSVSRAFGARRNPSRLVSPG